MKIAVSAEGPSWESRLDPRFGRCAFIVLVDTKDMSFEVFENPNRSLGGGAGIQSAQMVAEKGAEVVLTGNCGPNAYETLTAAGIGVVIGCVGTIAEVVEGYQTGKLHTADKPNVSDHFGLGGDSNSANFQSADPVVAQNTSSRCELGAGTGAGRGMGRGRGQGGGRGQGMGRGMGRGGGGCGMGMGRGRFAAANPNVGVPPRMVSGSKPPADLSLTDLQSSDQELEVLTVQATQMRKQLEAMQERIAELQQQGSSAQEEPADEETSK